MSIRRSVDSSNSASSSPATSPRLYRTRFNTSVQGDTLPSVYQCLVPIYKSAVYPNFTMNVAKWDDEYSRGVQGVSAKRAANRIANYVDQDELLRADTKLDRTDSASIRFGVKKEGHGYHGERGDFCLLAGSIQGKHLHLFYRSLELIGGLAYDLCIIEHLGDYFSIPWKSVTFHAAKANVFALKGNSNEKLYPKFKEILGI